MSTPGSIPYRQERLRQRIVQAKARAKQIAQGADANFDGWPAMTDQEKDTANRSAQRAIADLARAIAVLATYALGDLSDDA